MRHGRRGSIGGGLGKGGFWDRRWVFVCLGRRTRGFGILGVGAPCSQWFGRKRRPIVGPGQPVTGPTDGSATTQNPGIARYHGAIVEALPRSRMGHRFRRNRAG